jgi:outer membrane protein TolC
VIHQVRTAYYSFLVAREARAFADKLFQEIQTVQRLLQKQLKNEGGENILKVTKLDLMEIEGFHLHAKGLRTKTSSAESSALSYLTLAAGLSKPLQKNDIKGDADINIRLPLEADCVDKGLKSNPLFEVLNSGIEAHNSLFKAERAAMLPVLGVRGFYKKLETNGILKPDDYYGVSIVLKGPIFDSGEIWAKAHQHLSKARELGNRKTFLKSYLETSISTLYKEINSLQNNLKIDRQEMELIDKRLRLALFGLMNKIVPYRDYKDAFVMRSLVKKEYFERLLTFHEKVNQLIKMTGSSKLLI